MKTTLISVLNDFLKGKSIYIYIVKINQNGYIITPALKAFVEKYQTYEKVEAIVTDVTSASIGDEGDIVFIRCRITTPPKTILISDAPTVITLHTLTDTIEIVPEQTEDKPCPQCNSRRGESHEFGCTYNA